MRLLLDTHAFLWFVMGDANLSSAARLLIEDVKNVKLVSIITAWEIAIKSSLGKLTLARPFDVLLPDEIQKNGFDLLPLEMQHLAALTALPFHHRDPFDRSLVAQSFVEAAPLVSNDTALDAYGVTRLW